MATYNGSAYILEQLQSIANQSLKPDRVIVSDDCSSDNTLSIIREFALKNSINIEILDNQNQLGCAQNFNRALNAADGDVIFLSDQDDVWFDNKLEVIANYFKNSNKILVMNDSILTDGDLHSSGITKLQNFNRKSIPLTGFVMGCCAAIRYEFLEKTLPIPEPSQHDDWIVGFAIGLNVREIHFEPLQFYRRHGSNDSRAEVNDLTHHHLPFKKLFFIESHKNQLDKLKLELLVLKERLKRLNAHKEYFISCSSKANFEEYFNDISRNLLIISKRVDALSRKDLTSSLKLLFKLKINHQSYKLASLVKDLLIVINPFNDKRF